MEQNPQKTALLIMDMRAGILQMLPDTTALVSNVSKAIATARSHNVRVIYVTVGFRQGTPEISMNNKGFSASKGRFATTNVDEFMKIDSSIAPEPDEIRVTKRRVSAFTGSDLEVILTAHRTHRHCYQRCGVINIARSC